MKLLQIVSGALVVTSAAASVHLASLPFNLTYLFTAHLDLGAASQPISIQGGFRVPEPILNGTVAGPAINATIYPGLALPAVTENQTLQSPIIELYGMTNDGVAFRLHEEGVGDPSGQITRIQMEIGGGAKYAQLRDGFIIASVNPSKDRTSVTARGYLVQNTAMG